MLMNNETPEQKDSKEKQATNTMVKKRQFILNEQVSHATVKPIITGILEINRIDDEEQEKNPDYVRKPIKLVVDSFGGSIYCGNALVSAIDSSETPVHTYCYGKAMSMGFMIFAIGHKRFAHRLACLMYHDGSSVVKGTPEDMMMDVEQLRKLVGMGEQILIQNTKLSKQQLEDVRKSRTNWYIFGEEAMSYGIVDELLESKRQKL